METSSSEFSVSEKAGTAYEAQNKDFEHNFHTADSSVQKLVTEVELTKDVGTSIDQKFAKPLRSRNCRNQSDQLLREAKRTVSVTCSVGVNTQRKRRKSNTQRWNSHETKSDESIYKSKEKESIKGIDFECIPKSLRIPLNALLVIYYNDEAISILVKAAKGAGFKVTQTYSEDTALVEYQMNLHDLVIMDCRVHNKIDFRSLCGTIRNIRGSNHTVMIAFVKNKSFDQNDMEIVTLLNCGFNRCLSENTNLYNVTNELLQLKLNDIRLLARHAICQCISVAMEKCKDIVLITDNNYKCQYINRAFPKFSKTYVNSLLGKSLEKCLFSESFQVAPMTASLREGSDWTGALTLKNQNHEILHTLCRASPFFSVGNVPSHFILIIDSSQIFDAVEHSKSSLHLLKKEPVERDSVKSETIHGTSFAICSNVHKALEFISRNREFFLTSPQFLQSLDNIANILRTPELNNSSFIKTNERENAITTQHITTLLLDTPSFSYIYQNINSSFEEISTLPCALTDLLNEALMWEFDIFRLEDLTKNHPLQFMGMKLFAHFSIPYILKCDEKILQQWLIVLETNYHKDNSYHNSTHAADVMQATAHFLEKDKIKCLMDPLDEAICLIAAAAHDADHPGRSNAFLVNSGHILAVLYNDLNILESHHAALMFRYSLVDDRINIFKNLDKTNYRAVRQNIIDMILATEMTKHFEHLSRFINICCSKESEADACFDMHPASAQECNSVVKRMIIKCSDISNPTRPIRLCIEWARRIAEEYFSQTDEENERGLPVVMPMFERTSCSIPKSQLGFIDYIISDLFEAWNAYIDMPELITYIRQNYIKWKELDEGGFITLADIINIQSSVLLCPMFPFTRSHTSRSFENPSM